MASYALISIVKLCKAGCEVSFTKWGIGVEFRYIGQLIIKGSKCTSTGLCMVPLLSPPCTTTSSSIKQKSTNGCNPSNELYAGNFYETSSQAELAMYHHQSLGSPPKSTLLQDIKRHPDLYSTFPGLNYEIISNHLPPSEATEKLHMIQRRQGINSTRNNKQTIIDARQYIKNMFPTEHVCSAMEDEIFCCNVIGDTHEDTIYSDLTGRFPIQSYEGMNYIFVAYVYKLNAILLCSMKSREDVSMVEAFTSVYTKLETAGHNPKLHILDNECSRAVQKFSIKKGTTRENV